MCSVSSAVEGANNATAAAPACSLALCHVKHINKDTQNAVGPQGEQWNCFLGTLKGI